MDPDSVSYFDMGDFYWKANWHTALNSYWSPLYGWITGFMFLTSKPAMRWEYPEAHLLNFAILMAALFCFEFFWRELLAFRSDNAWAGSSQRYAWVLGYLLFAYVHLAIHPLSMLEPDLLVAALVYIASGMMLRFASGRMATVSAFLLGVLLGVGYLTKAAMLPFAFILMATMLGVAWRQHRRKLMVAATLLGFLVTSLPFIAALSLNMHRFTFGDSAKMVYAYCVNQQDKDIPHLHYWQGDMPGHLDALHPARQLFAWPEVYEFATPIAGTYPLWYDPVYWNAGLDSSVHIARELQALARNLKMITIYVILRSGCLTTVVLMFVLGGRIRDSWRNLMAFWPILVPAVAVFLMYMMVHWEARFTSGEFLVLWGAAIVSTNTSGEARSTKVYWAASFLLCVLFVRRYSLLMLEEYRQDNLSSQTVTVAEDLRTSGIEPGDPIAVIGYGNHAAYWARLGRLKIVAEVPHLSGMGDSATAFWNSGPESEKAVLNILKGTGARAVIAEVHPAALPPGWIPMGDTGRALYFLRSIPGDYSISAKN